MRAFCTNAFIGIFMKPLFYYILLIVPGLLLMGCPGTRYEDRYVSRPEVAQNKVDKAFDLAKGFAKGTVPIESLKSTFDTLTDEEMATLKEKQDKDNNDFGQFVVMGVSSAESMAIAKRYLQQKSSWNDEKQHLKCQAWIEALRVGRRPTNEKPIDHYKTTALLLTHCPDQINDLNNVQKTLDATWFNGVVTEVEPSNTQMLDKLSDKKLYEWFSWATPHLNDAQPVFAVMLVKASNKTQDKLRNRLLSEYSKTRTDLETLIDQASLWGLNLENDQFVMPALTPGTSFQGSLLYVLTKRAISGGAIVGNRLSQAMHDLRGYAEKIKTALGANYVDHITVRDFGIGALEKIHTVLEAALSPTHYEAFTDYVLDVNTPKDVYNAAGQPEAEVSNQMLKELYLLVIDSNQKAEALGHEPIGGGAEKFIHRLVQRNANSESGFLLNDFLGRLGGTIGERAQLTNNDGGNFPIALAVTNAGDPLIRQTMVNRLLKEDDGTAVATLTQNQLKELVDNAFNHRGFGDNGPENFKLLYTTLHAYPAQQQILRSRLLEKANNDPNDVQDLVDRIVDAHDVWGLKGGLTTDDYTLPTVPNPGSLLYVLTKKAVGINTTTGFLALRGYAKAIRASLGDLAYSAYLTHANVLDPPGLNTIASILNAHLTPKHQQNFSNYYLGKETVADLYAAADIPENDLPNHNLKELFDAIINNDNAQVLALAAEGGGGANRFLHRLLKRSTDGEGNSKYMLSKFLDGLGGAAQETLNLDDNSGGATPLKVLFNAARILPAGHADVPHQKTAVIERLVRNIGPLAVAGVTGGDLFGQMSLLLTMPASFKKLYNAFPNNSMERLFLRTTLLEDAYGKPAPALKKVIADITDAADIWGLRSGIENDVYELNKNPGPGVWTGPLLYVLARRAVDDKNTNTNPNAYVALGELALLVKNAFSLLGANFSDHISVTQYGAPPQTIIGLLTDPGFGGLAIGFAQSYVAAGTINSLFSSVDDLGGVTNSLLKELYMLIVANDDAKASALSLLTDVAHHNETFLHKLLKRTADADTSAVLHSFLTAVFHGGGAAAELALLNNDLGTGSYPIKILADLLIPARAGDNPTQKASMFTRLLEHDDGTAASTITGQELFAQKFFSAGTKGQEAFAKFYAKFAADPLKQEALRSSLIDDAHGSPPGGLANLTTLVEQITNPSDTWGLRATLSTDIFRATNRFMHFHVGNLLFVLTSLAIEDARAAPSVAKGLEVYSALRNSARMIKNTLEAAVANTYFAYVTAATSDAIALLKANLDATHGGFAEYFLDYNQTPIPDLDAARLLFAASRVTNDTKVLKWLYDNYFTDGVAIEIANLPPLADGNNFIHNLVRKENLQIPYDILINLFARLEPAHAALRTALVSADNADGKNPIKLMLGKNIPPGVPQNLLSAMVTYANQAAIEENIRLTHLVIDTDKLLTFIKGNSLAVLNVFNQADDQDRLGALAYWCGAETDNYQSAATSVDTFKSAFRHRYGALAAFPNKQATMRNKLFAGALTGFSAKEKRLNDASVIVDEGFLDFVVLSSNTFDPMDTGRNSTLLYAAIESLQPQHKVELAQLITALKTKFNVAADWRLYLDTPNNDGVAGLQSIMNLVIPMATSRADAEDWLAY